ncbi:hypothetical protein NQ318_012599 [Aromia moschata]|uniref:Uncharacterized protein n=1 Tax=Aromia moschata TaxID=1265417 RepID=A0AAV8YIV7_9CUCU|nr:hypothetical protein NQ318_012599 [Aromia moschata]
MATMKNRMPPTTPAVMALCLTLAGTANFTSSLLSGGQFWTESRHFIFTVHRLYTGATVRDLPDFSGLTYLAPPTPVLLLLRPSAGQAPRIKCKNMMLSVSGSGSGQAPVLRSAALVRAGTECSCWRGLPYIITYPRSSEMLIISIHRDVYLTEMHMITILQMIGYGDRTHTQAEVVRLFEEKYPELPPISQGTNSQLSRNQISTEPERTKHTFKQRKQIRYVGLDTISFTRCTPHRYRSNEQYEDDVLVAQAANYCNVTRGSEPCPKADSTHDANNVRLICEQ